MAQLIKINKQNLPVKEYNGQRVVTFKEIDTVHCRPSGSAHRNFKANRKRFIEGVDYFRRNSSEAKSEYGITAPNGLVLLTESGYLMLAKSFTDDLAWTVQRELVNCYFRVKSEKGAAKHDTLPEQLTLETTEYHYFDKTYKGEPVITLADFEYFTGVHHDAAHTFLKTYCVRATDYLVLEKGALSEFKFENRGVSRRCKALTILHRSAVEKLMKYYDCNTDMPKVFIESKAPKLPEKSTAGSVEVTLPSKKPLGNRYEKYRSLQLVTQEDVQKLVAKHGVFANGYCVVPVAELRGILAPVVIDTAISDLYKDKGYYKTFSLIDDVNDRDFEYEFQLEGLTERGLNAAVTMHNTLIKGKMTITPKSK